MRWALGIGLALVAASSNAQQAIVLAPGEVLLEVDATGEIKSAPDQATVFAGVVTEAPTARGAVEANSRAMARLVAAIRAAGVAEREVRTQDVSVSPRYSQPPRDYDGQQFVPRIVGYTANNSVRIELADPSRLSALLDAMTAAGANPINGPNFALADDRAVALRAREQAVARAREQAEVLARAAGMRVARTLRISERGGRGEYMGFTGSDIYVTASRAGAPSPPPPAPPVQIGEISTTRAISIDYALVPR